MKVKNFLKSLFSKDNLLYLIIFIIDITIIIVNRAINGFHNILWICDIASILGVLNTIYAAKHSVKALIFNFFSTLILIVTNIYQHIWLNTFTCTFICAPSLLLGIIRWKKNEKNNNDNNLNQLSKKWSSLTWGLYIVISVVFIFILKAINGNLYIFDAIYSAGCVFGVVLSSYAYIDQFLFFIFANIFGVTMYALLTIQNINNLPLLFSAINYLVMDIIGYINWKKLKKLDKAENKSLK